MFYIFEHFHLKIYTKLEATYSSIVSATNPDVILWSSSHSFRWLEVIFAINLRIHGVYIQIYF